MDILESLNWRYAVKEFDSKKRVRATDLDIILEALRLTASSFGLQPWKFVVVENKELREKLVPVSWNQRQISDASHLIVFSKPKKFGEKEVKHFVKRTAEVRGVELSSLEGFEKMMTGFISRMSEADLNEWMTKQIYIALGNLLTVCATMKIDTCPIEGFSKKDYDEILGLEKHGVESVVICPIGYRSEGDKYIERPKVRFPKSEVILTL